MAINMVPTDNAEFEKIAQMLGITATPQQISDSSAYEMAEWIILSRIPDAASATGERLTQIKLALRFLACYEIMLKDRTLMEIGDPDSTSEAAMGVVRSISRTQGADSEQVTYENRTQLTVKERANVFLENADQILDKLSPDTDIFSNDVSVGLTRSRL